MHDDDLDPELTEMTVLHAERVDAVRGPANGMPLLVIKALADDTPAEKAMWDAAYVNDLPDSSFAYVEPGGEKDDDGKTVPRSLRHFPYKDADGKVDLPHLRNALSRAPQSEWGDNAMPKLKAAARAEGIGEFAEKSREELHAETMALLASLESVVAKYVSIPGMGYYDNRNGGKVKIDEPGAPEPDAEIINDEGEVEDEDEGTEHEFTITVEVEDEAEKAEFDSEVMDASGNTPGSPEWEADDSKALTAVAAQLAKIANALSVSLEREGMEVAAGHAEDACDVWDLSDAIDCVECALSIVSRIAFREYAEANKEVGEGNLAERLLAARDRLDRALVAVKSNTTTDAGAPGDLEEGIDMERSELEALIDERVEASVSKALDSFGKKFVKKVRKAIVEGEDIADDAEAEPTAEIADAEPASDEAVKSADEQPADGSEGGEPDVLVAALETLTGAVKGIDQRLAKVEGTPIPGGVALNGATPGADSTASEVAKSDSPWEQAMSEAHTITDPVAKAERLTELSQARLSALFGATGRLPGYAGDDDLVNAAVPVD